MAPEVQAEIPSASALDGAQALDLRILWRVVHRRRWAIAAFFVATVVGVTAFTLRQQKVYSASCTLIIDVAAPRVLDNQQVQDVVDTGTGSYWYNKEYYETQYKVIASRAVVGRAADKLHLGSNLQFLGLDKLPDAEQREKALLAADPAALLIRQLKVQPVKDSRMVRVTIEDRDPVQAAALANGVAEAYIAESLSVKLQTTHSASQWLEDQLSDLKEKLGQSEEQLFNFKKDNDILSTSWEDKQSMVSQSLVALNDALTKVRTQKAQLQARVDGIAALRAQAEGGDDSWAESVSTVATNYLIQQLKLRFLDVKNECSDVKERYLDQHPKYMACEERLTLARKNLRKEIDTSLAAVRNEYREVSETEKNLVALFEKTKAEAFDTNKKERDYMGLRRNQENNQRLYDMVLKRLKEADLSGLLRMSNIRILDRALPPGSPARPNVPMNLSMALLFGLLGGVALAFALEFLDTTVTSQEQIEERLGLTFLGIIPSITGIKEGQSQDLVVHDQPKSSVAECCRSIRTNLLFMSPDKPLRTMLVTSSGPRDGKTTTAASLAIAMAESGNRVLLVDTDMRRPRIHKAFRVANNVGVSSLILGQGRLEDAVKATEVPNLSVLTCGPIPPNPAELLHTQAFADLVKRLSERYDRVIFDSPPIGAVADAAVVSTQVDGTVVVLKARQTSRDLARRTVRTLSDVNARIFGAVLNDLDLEDRNYGEYFYYYHRYGYYYGEKKDEAVF